MNQGSVRPATMDDVDACATILARAFHDDPGAVIFDPDPARRASMLPGFFRTFLEASLDEGGDIVVAGDPVGGLACWFGPDRHGPSEAGMAAHGLADVLEQWGPDASARIVAMTAEIERQHERLIDGPHLRLDFFGVDPVRQGSGLGSALLGHGHEIADAAGLPSYLETFTRPNVTYYERRGYGVIGKYFVDNGVPVYALVRPPGSAAGASRP